MDWLYLYNANPDVKNPDHLLMVTGQNQKIQGQSQHMHASIFHVHNPSPQPHNRKNDAHDI